MTGLSHALTYNEEHLRSIIEMMKNAIKKFNATDTIHTHESEMWYGRLSIWIQSSELIKCDPLHDTNMVREFDECIDEVSRQLTKATAYYY